MNYDVVIEVAHRSSILLSKVGMHQVFASNLHSQSLIRLLFSEVVPPHFEALVSYSPLRVMMMIKTMSRTMTTKDVCDCENVDVPVKRMMRMRSTGGGAEADDGDDDDDDDQLPFYRGCIIRVIDMYDTLRPYTRAKSYSEG